MEVGTEDTSMNTPNSLDISPNTQLVLGWDCANKSLGWCVLEIDIELWKRGKAAYDRLAAAGVTLDDYHARRVSSVVKPDLLECVGDVYKSAEWCRMVAIDVVDLHPGETTPTDDVVRTVRLRTMLDTVFPDGKWNGRMLTVGIEHQQRFGGSGVGFGGKNLGPNLKSFIVQMQLAMYFAQGDVRMISPKLKQNIDTGAGVCENPREYRSRKQHAVDSLLAWAPVGHIPRAVLDDAGDAFLTAYVTCLRLLQEAGART